MGITNDIINSEPVKSLTHFLAEIVGKPLVDGAGLLYGDALKMKRISNSLALEKKYNLVKGENIKATSLSFGYKLLEKATIEEDESLLDKWANLLANATDSDFNGSIRKIFLDILETLEPIDVKIFDDINKVCLSNPTKYRTMVSLNTPDNSTKESLNVLLSLGLITYGVSRTEGIRMGGHTPTIFHGLDSFKVTELGESFYNSVNR